MGRFAANQLSGFQAIEPGHGDVQDHDVWIEFLCPIHSLLAVYGLAADFPFRMRFQQ